MKRTLLILAMSLPVVIAGCGEDPSGPTLPVDEPAYSLSAGGRTLRVTHVGDDGAGSFRAAIEAANANPAVRTIRFDKGLGTVQLSATVVYTGSQSLRIEGRDAVLDLSDAPFDGNGLASTGGADLVMRNLTIANASGHGLFVDVPGYAEDDLQVSLTRVTLEGNGRHGLFIDDQTNDVDQTGADSDAGVVLRITSSEILDNGFRPDVSDFDGVRVDEGGPGRIAATILSSRFTGNAGDGVELDEMGPGDVVLNAIGSDFDDNGAQPQDPDDLEDGLDIDEAGPGSIQVALVRVSANGNSDEGIDFDEEGTGDINAAMTNVEASRNIDSGITFTEDENELAGGSVRFVLTNVTASGSSDDDGLKLEEFGDGDLNGTIVNSSIEDNADDGIQVEQADAGDGRLRLLFVSVAGNADDDINADNVEVVRVPSR